MRDHTDFARRLQDLMQDSPALRRIDLPHPRQPFRQRRRSATRYQQSSRAPRRNETTPQLRSHPSIEAHASSDRRCRSYLSKRQKLVIAPVKIKRMVPARCAIPNDANTGDASALIAITAPEAIRPRVGCRQAKENAGARRPRSVWEERFKALVLFVTTAMYRPYGLDALPRSTRTSVTRRQEKRRQTRSACRQALAP